ncbi:MAG TPA: glycosyltransferase family 39 protein [Planctomycetota bacterium]
MTIECPVSAAERAAPAAERMAPAAWGAIGVAAILLIALLTKVVIAWVTPVTSDECFHWLQGQHLAWGFSDHPPGTAALSRLSTAWFGNTWLGLRLVPIVGSLLCSAIAWAILREVGADRGRAAAAAACVQLLPMLGIGMLMVPSVPHAPVVFAAEYMLLRALRRGGVVNHIAWGALLGAAFLTYYLTAAGALAAAVFLAIDPRGRRALRDWRLWLGALVAAAVFAPNLAWNLTQSSASAMRFQLVERNTSSFSPQYLVAFLALAVVVAGPLLLPALRGGWSALRNRLPVGPAGRERDDDWRPFFASFLLVVLALFAAISITTRAGAHWAVLAYLNVPLLLFAPQAEPLARGWQRAALGLGAALTAGVFVVAAVGFERIVEMLPGADGSKGVGRERFLRFHDAAMRARGIAEEAANGGQATLLAADRWSHASLLAFHGGGTEVAQYPPAVRHGRDFRTWSRDVTGPVELVYVTTTPDVDGAVRAASRSVQRVAVVGDAVEFAWIHRCSGFVPPPEWQ